VNCLLLQRVRPLGGPPVSQPSQSSANMRPQISTRLLYCHAVWCSFVCCFDVWELSEVSFYRAMLCIRGTSRGSVSVCLSQVGVLLKRLNVGSHKQHHTISQGLWFSDAKDLHEIRPGSPPTRVPNAGGVGQNRATFD